LRKQKKNAEETDVEEEMNAGDYRSQLLLLIQELPPSGFEQLCQRLLRESGFQKVSVTGKSGDGGIDGHGILQVNAFVSFQVYFQCKRYKDSVGAPMVRDFRGAMMGRADKGIILTTGTFTSSALTCHHLNARSHQVILRAVFASLNMA
jgi:restriction system protein